MDPTDSSQPDVKPTLFGSLLLDTTAAASVESSTNKRRRHQGQHTPRKSKLRKLNASSLRPDVLGACQYPHSADIVSDHPAAQQQRCPLPAGGTVAKLLAATALLCTIGGICVPSVIPELLLDAIDECRLQFETEFNAFVYDDDGRSAIASTASDPFAATVRKLHEQVAHQNGALAAIERMLRNHTHPANAARLSAAALIGGSGTGKTLSAGIVMREWLRPAGAGNVLHYVWSPSTPLHRQPFHDLTLADGGGGAQLSRYEANLLVVDSIPPRHAADMRRFHAALLAARLAQRQRRTGAPVLVVYVFNVPTFGLADVQRLDATVAALQQTMADESAIVPIVFEPLGRVPGQLNECIDRERRRLRLAADALTEAQRRLIGEGIDVRLSGCKHVGARMAMYL